jgi:hypothetical protein
MIVALAVKVFFVVVLALEPGDSIMALLVNQAYVVLVGDLVVISAICYLGWWTYRSFGVGAMSIIRKTNDDEVKLAFI